MIHSGVIEISPLAYMRGRTFKGAYIIADEMQNSTPNQMLMLTTRIGAGSKMAITGDLKQSDRSASNGLLDIMSKIREQTLADSNFPIKMVEMNYGDIERSPIVATILAMYQNKVGSVKSKEKAFDMDAALMPLSHMEKL
jgi:phosphate starvation-inducible PhoH-like protein